MDTQEREAAAEFNENIDLFNYNPDDEDNQEEEDLTGFDNIIPKTVEKEENPGGENTEVDDDEKLKFEEEDKSKEDNDDFDLDELNKKFGTEYKTKEDFKAALNGKVAESEEEKETKELSDIEETISLYTPYLNLSSEDLMRKQFQTIALQNKKDLNDEDVKIEIEEKVQDLIDKGTLDLWAKDLRSDLRDKILNPAIAKKDAIVNAQKQRIETNKKTERDQLQNAFAEFHTNGNFYGIKPDKNKIIEVYKTTENGEFLKKISSDPKLRAELALIASFKEEIFKKSTGLNYGDGMKAVLDEFKSKKETVDASRVQSKGGSAGTNKSEGLVADILYEAPKGEEKKRTV